MISSIIDLSEEEELHYYLAKKEGWIVEPVPNAGRGEDPYCIITDSGSRYPLVHPYDIHMGIYRDSRDVNEKYKHLVAAHHYLWPQFKETWTEWDEATFYAHCSGYSSIILASGAGAGKSHRVARIGLLWWLANPKHRAVIVASTTLESLQGRIWGYVVKLLNETAFSVGAKDFGGQTPRILFPGVRNKIHGMFAIPVKDTAKDADNSAKTLSNAIGRHPDEGLIAILDECPFMTAKIIDAVPNWERGVEFFQLWGLGNSDSKNDLHGALATPRAGWKTVHWQKDDIWPTTHKNGICLYFNPYKSPAITEVDPIKKAILSKFYITAEQIEAAKRTYGEDSANFYRMILGFWPPGDSGATIVSEAFLTEQQVSAQAEWSGFFPLHVVAGLDSAITVGGKGCKLRLAVLGHTMDGRVCLDYQGTKLLFDIEIKTSSEMSGERQLCERVLDVLEQYQCPLSALVIDATGLGRAIGELLSIVNQNRRKVWEEPFRIVSTRLGSGKEKPDDPRILVYNPTDLWTRFRSFVMHDQVRGLDNETKAQLINRQLIKVRDKHVLESKNAYKSRMASINPGLAHSPDEADSAILALFSGILKYGFFLGQKKELPNTANYEDLIMQKMAALAAQRAGGLAVIGEAQNVMLPSHSLKIHRPNFGATLEQAVSLKIVSERGR